MTLPFIMVAPNGARRSKSDHSALPITIPQIVDEAVACKAAGADALHLHIRDDAGQHSLDPGRYREALNAVNDAVPQMRIQVTTESAGLFDVATQVNCLETLVPKWASISVREIAREPDMAQRVYHGCAERSTEVQHILYDQTDIDRFRALRSAGTILPGQSHAIFVLGEYQSGRPASPADLEPFLHLVPDLNTWMVCAFGPQEHKCLAEAAKRGGLLRVGFENSLTQADGTPHSNNAASVARLIGKLNGAQS